MKPMARGLGISRSGWERCLGHRDVLGFGLRREGAKLECGGVLASLGFRV